MSRKNVANHEVLNYAFPASATLNLRARATLVVQDLTYTSVAYSSGANSITIAYTAGGTAGAEVVTVVGNAISVQIQNSASTATQIKAAIDGSAAALALVSVAVTGTGGSAQVTAAATPLAGGVTSPLNLTTDTITKTAHGYVTGTALAISGASLPTGLTATTYYVIKLTADTFQLASTLANAELGVAVDITGEGSGTVTMAAGDYYSEVTDIRWLDNVSWQVAWTDNLAATLAIQASNDYDPVRNTGTWNSVTVTGLSAPAGTAGSYIVQSNQMAFAFVRLFADYTSGAGTLTVHLNAKMI